MHQQAMDLDPTDATLPSNRSLCWIRLGQAERALADAKVCRTIRPDWPKACYREGAALRLLQAFFLETIFALYCSSGICALDLKILLGRVLAEV